MSGGYVDLRSDTVTRPGPDMLAAMLRVGGGGGVGVGDDVYGEDPAVNALQERVAAMLGHDAGLFTPTGTMANQLGLRLHAGPGTEILAESAAHILRAELGAAALLSAITTRTWTGPRGLVEPELVAELIAPPASPYLVSTSAIAVENTHNFGGGTVQPIERLRRLRALADEYNLTMHLDGARLWNAHIATGVPLGEYGALFDTVSVCFSKGLGAPVGSMLVGRTEAIAEARVWRKRWGGGMRQVGVLAAAAEYALDHHLADLAVDHAHAALLAEAIAAAVPGVVNQDHVETNIVMLDVRPLGMTAGEFADAAKADGVLVSVMGSHTARLVTHRDADRAGIERALAVLLPLLGASR